MQYSNLIQAIEFTKTKLLSEGRFVETESWQGLRLNRIKIRFFEVLDVQFSAEIPNDIERLKIEICPNLPWADNHFLERISGRPINPGNEYRNWPYYKKDSAFRHEDGKFTHTYMERIWAPKSLKGIRYRYGNLHDVVELLNREPFTRQAFLPIWFPEDTGAVHGGRVPCTIGYHFILRDSRLNIFYAIRSCDYVRHFRDDVYFACRTVMWVLDQLKKRDNRFWDKVRPGFLSMHIYSLHIFDHDVSKLSENPDYGKGVR